MTTLTLGGVAFQGFEIPDSLNFGGEQALAIHKFPGGSRTVDSMGPDDDDIRWSGRFRGTSAEQRATLLDYMRRQGQQILLALGNPPLPGGHQGIQADVPPALRDPLLDRLRGVVYDEAQAIAGAAIGFLESLAGDAVAGRRAFGG